MQEVRVTVPVSSRISPELADRIATRAESLGISLSKMLALVINRGFQAEAAQRKALEEANREQSDRFKTVVIQLINEIAENEEDARMMGQRFMELMEEANEEG